MQLGTLVSTTLIGFVSLFGLPAPSTQVAAAAQGGDGSCQKQYDYCMNNTAKGIRSNCETLWKGCVVEKCDVSRLLMRCVKDSDCRRSCTEAASSKVGLLSCCATTPQHDNKCPTKIDGRCTKPGEAFPYSGGPSTPDGQRGASDEALKLSEFLTSKSDTKSEISPDALFKYPEGTSFDESGLPSQPPLPKPNFSGQVANPNSPYFQEWEQYKMDNPQLFNGEQLPIEYRPDRPYVPSTGERIFELGSGGSVIYSTPVEDFTEQELKLFRDYPVYTPQPSVQSQSTFSPQQAPVQSAAHACSWSLWGYCVWY